MSSPLDRIEDYAEAFLTGQQKRDVLALVNVAKAAEGVEIMLRQRQSRFDNETGSPYAQLREALAALNKEPSL